MPLQLPIKHLDPSYKIKILDYTYTSEPSINSALPLQFSKLKLIFFLIGCIISSGFLWLLSKWSAKKKSIMLYNVCDVEDATAFLIEEEDIVGGSTIVERGDMFDIRRKVLAIRFIYHERTFLYHEEKEVFLPVRYQELGVQLDKLKKNKYKPYSKQSRKRMLQYYGINVINLKVQTMLQVFIAEMLTPYQVFQTYAIILWIYEKYYIFSFMLLAYSIYIYWKNSSDVVQNQKKLAEQSIFQLQCKVLTKKGKGESFHQGENSQDMSIVDYVHISNNESKKNKSHSSKNEDKFHPMSEQIEPKMHIISEEKKSEFTEENQPQIFKDFQTDWMSSHDLVPGDIIILKEGDTIPCDCILLAGEILVNQSYISGEDYLIRKGPMENYIYSKQKEKTFSLYMGTKIVKSKNKFGRKIQQSFLDTYHENQLSLHKFASEKQIVCLITQTNYNTLRGKYLRAIRYQKKSQENFTKETIYFIYIILAITTFAFLIILPKISKGQKAFDLFITYLDLLSDSIPMTLPAALSVGINFARHRLKQYDISVILPSNILAAGRADTIVLDSCKAFGRDYKVESIMAGTKGKRTFGNTYKGLDDFLDLTTSENLTQSCQGSPEKMNDIIEKGKNLFKAISCCHSLQKYNNKITGMIEEKKLFSFARAKFIEDDLYECLDEKLVIKERIYFKEKEDKFAVLVEPHTEKKEEKKKEEKKEISLMEEEEIDEQEEMFEEVKLPEKNSKLIFIKGSPQKILKLCFEDSYPINSDEYILDMAQKGFKLICYAYKYIYDDFNTKNSIPLLKDEFVFLGYAALQLKQYNDTPEAMEELKKGKLHIMLTSQQRQLETSSTAISNNICSKNELLFCSKNGDRIICRGHTEWNSSGEGNDLAQFIFQSEELMRNSYVSLSSGLYEQLYMKNDDNASNAIFKKAIIFNTMDNRHSRNLYLQLQKKGYSSFAVGTGSNVSQCANLSLELNRGQCSLLSSFHTPNKSLLTISNCLRVCRAALSTNYHCFSMMVHFSLIQFTTVALLEYHYQCITDSQMLYEDLFVTFPIFVTINMTLPASKLSKQLPSGSFFSPRSLASMIGQFFIQLIVQICFVGYMLTIDKFAEEKQDSYKQFLKNGEFVETDVALATFILTNYLYLGIVLSTSVSKPWRKSFYTNIFYTLTLILLWLYNTGMVFLPSITIDDVRQENKHKKTEEMLVLATLLGNLVMVLMYLYENFLLWIRELFIKQQNREHDQIQS